MTAITHDPTRVRRLLVALLAAVTAVLLALAASPATAAPPPQASKDRVVTVMTRNLYLGATLAPLFPQPPAPAHTQQTLVAAATGMWWQVAATNFPVRAQELAREIATAQPDLVGLQEVTLYRVDPINPANPTADATTVRLDFLAVLQDELRARGQRYDVVVSKAAFNGQLPAYDWPPPLGTGALSNVRLTDRDVILVRRTPQTAGLKLSNAQSGLFSATLELPVLDEWLPIDRGWTAVDVKLRGREFRFVNTHLEAFHPGVAYAQALELIAGGPADTSLPVVLLGDFNSVPGHPQLGAAYAAIQSAGFADVAPSGAPTCCFDAALVDLGEELTTRIDLVLTRGPITAQSVERVGATPFRAAQPLWASDHAGLVAELVLE
jgi:endonuclease/exonuclease/phosphatase family metal-dependent hydrolase